MQTLWVTNIDNSEGNENANFDEHNRVFFEYVPGSDVTGYDIWTDAEKQAWESRWLSEYLTPVQED